MTGRRGPRRRDDGIGAKKKTVLAVGDEQLQVRPSNSHKQPPSGLTLNKSSACFLPLGRCSLQAAT